MILLIFGLFLFLDINAQINMKFTVVGLSTNFTIIYVHDRYCDYNSCQQIICGVLSNTTSSYVVLDPNANLSSCPKTLPNNINVNMINFIVDGKQNMILPNSCNNLGSCLINSCNSYILNPKLNPGLLAFTGTCLNS